MVPESEQKSNNNKIIIKKERKKKERKKKKKTKTNTAGARSCCFPELLALKGLMVEMRGHFICTKATL